MAASPRLHPDRIRVEDENDIDAGDEIMPDLKGEAAAHSSAAEDPDEAIADIAGEEGSSEETGEEVELTKAFERVAVVRDGREMDEVETKSFRIFEKAENMFLKKSDDVALKLLDKCEKIFDLPEAKKLREMIRAADAAVQRRSSRRSSDRSSDFRRKA